MKESEEKHDVTNVNVSVELFRDGPLPLIYEAYVLIYYVSLYTI